MKTNKFKAFTLAEVLITLVIIGVIAAITVPTIIANAQESEMNARAKKMFSTLANAMTMVKVAGGDFDFEAAENNQAEANRWFDNYLKPHLNIVKNCYNTAGCWTEGHTKALNGQNAYVSYEGHLGNYSIHSILNDGSFLNTNVWGGPDAQSKCKVNIKTANALILTFDVNGAKKPNTIGKDIFVAVFTENGLVPAFKNATTQEINANCSPNNTTNYAGYACLIKLLGK